MERKALSLRTGRITWTARIRPGSASAGLLRLDGSRPEIAGASA